MIELVDGKRINELDQAIQATLGMMIPVDVVGWAEAKYITIQQLADVIGQGSITYNPITATPGILNYSVLADVLTGEPYSTKKLTLPNYAYLYSGTTNPTSTVRLNVDGKLYATELNASQLIKASIATNGGAYIGQPVDRYAIEGGIYYNVDNSCIACAYTDTTVFYKYANDNLMYDDTNTLFSINGTVKLVSGTISKYLYLDASNNITFVDAPAVTLTDNILRYTTNTYSAYLDKIAIIPAYAYFYKGTTNPTSTQRLNLDGYLYATNLYDNGNRVVSAVSDGIFDLTLTTNTLSFAPYSSKQSSLVHFYTSATYPTNTTRVNFDANLFLTEVNVLTSSTIGARLLNSGSLQLLNTTNVFSIVSNTTSTEIKSIASGVYLPTYIGNIAGEYINIDIANTLFEVNTTNIKLTKGTPLKWLALDSNKNIIYQDAPSSGYITSVADGIFDLNVGANILSFYPYVTQQSGGKFDVSSTNPTASTRLNYNGALYAKQFATDGLNYLGKGLLAISGINGAEGYPCITLSTFSTNAELWAYTQGSGHVGFSYKTYPIYIGSVNTHAGVFTNNEWIKIDDELATFTIGMTNVVFSKATGTGIRVLALDASNIVTYTSISSLNFINSVTDGIFDLSISNGSLSVAPYALSTAGAGKFNTSSAAPTNTTRLNYDGILYATGFNTRGSGAINKYYGTDASYNLVPMTDPDIFWKSVGSIISPRLNNQSLVVSTTDIFTAITGTGVSTAGVIGNSTSSSGVVGTSVNASGVYGVSTLGVGVSGMSNTIAASFYVNDFNLVSRTLELLHINSEGRLDNGFGNAIVYYLDNPSNIGTGVIAGKIINSWYSVNDKISNFELWLESKGSFAKRLELTGEGLLTLNGDFEIEQGKCRYHRQNRNVDTVGDWREYCTTSMFYIQYYDGHNWITKQTITI